jgi:LCP family protein required for cell wall assembly
MASTPPHRGSASVPGDPSGERSGAGDPGAPRWTGRARVTTSTPPRSNPSTYGSARPQPPVSPPPRQTPTTRRGVRPRWGRIALVLFAVILVAVGAIVVTNVLWLKNVDEGLNREDPFAALEGRPQKLADGTINILLLGSDSRDPDSPTVEGGPARTDTIVIMHIPASHDRAYMVSIPRDTWVYIPGSPDGQNGDTMAKINAAFAWGGMPLMISTVELYTGVRMDHVAQIDFGGFVEVTDAVGGVDMTIDQTITSIHPPYRVFNAGPYHFNGEEALDYVRQRYQYPDGDFTRMRHQHEFLKALLDKAVSQGTLTNLGDFKSFVTSVAGALTVDKDFSLIDLGWQFRQLRSSNLTFLVSPTAGYDEIDGQDVVLSDSEKASALFNAMGNDTLTDWLAQNPDAVPVG